MGNTNLSTETLDIDVKFWDNGSFSARLFDSKKGFGDINDKVTELIINDTSIREEESKENIALANALSELIEKHQSELVKLYKHKLSTYEQ